MIGAVCTGMGFFGPHSVRFSSINNTVMTLFQMAFGEPYLEEMLNSNVQLAPVFFYIFTIIFYFVVMRFF